MSYFHPNLCLVICHLMPMELRVDSAQLQMKSTLNFKLVDSTRYTFVLKRCVTPWSQLLETGLKTKRTLLKLTQFLVAHCHIVENLKSNKLVSFCSSQVYYIKNSMCFLEKEQCVLKLVFLNICKGTVVQFKQYKRDFI